MTAPPSEKPVGFDNSPSEVHSIPVTVPTPQSGGIFNQFIDAYESFHQRRAARGLSHPEPVNEISRYVERSVVLKNQTFSGQRAELNKSFLL